MRKFLGCIFTCMLLPVSYMYIPGTKTGSPTSFEFLNPGSDAGILNSGKNISGKIIALPYPKLSGISTSLFSRHLNPGNEYENTLYNRNEKELYDLGDEKIRFSFLANGDAKIVNLETGDSNLITGGASLIKGYTLRDKDISWSTIFEEFRNGTGPTKSLITNFQNSNTGIFSSLQSYLSSYSTQARKASLCSSESKGLIKMDYGNTNPVLAKDMWEQMCGRTVISWYKLGNKTLFLMLDSKSWHSFFLRQTKDWERTVKKEFGNTYQTYIWLESNADVRNKVNLNENYYKKEIALLQKEIQFQKY